MKTMKKTSLYMAFAALAASAALTACDNDFATPPAILPPCYEIEGNTPLLDIKTDYWSQVEGHADVHTSKTATQSSSQAAYAHPTNLATSYARS